MDGRLPDLKQALDDAMIKYMDSNLHFKHHADLEKKTALEMVVNSLPYEDYNADVENTYQATSDAYDNYMTSIASP